MEFVYKAETFLILPKFSYSGLYGKSISGHEL